MDWIGLDLFGLDWIGLDWIGLDGIGLDRLTKELGNPGNVSTVHGLVILVYYPRFVYFSIVFRVC